MMIDSVTNVLTTQASPPSNSAFIRKLGTEAEPLVGPVLAQDPKTGEHFWTHGAVGSFRSHQMIAELRIVDSAGGVGEALTLMGRHGRGLDVYGGINRNFFTLSVPSGEFLTRQGSVTFEVTYSDGNTERVTFHMAPPDQAKVSKAASKLSGANVVAAGEVGIRLKEIGVDWPSSETAAGQEASPPSAATSLGLTSPTVASRGDTALASNPGQSLTGLEAEEPAGHEWRTTGQNPRLRQLWLQAYGSPFTGSVMEALSELA